MTCVGLQAKPCRGFDRRIRCPEEAPQYVADLVDACKAPAKERPTAGGQFVAWTHANRLCTRCAICVNA